MRIAVLIFVSALAGPMLDAQITAITTNLVAVGSQNCPVAASAERGAPGAVVQTGKDGSRSSGNKLYLHFLRVSPTSGKSLIAATVTLHGTDASPRAELATTSRSGNRTETFHLTSGDERSLRSVEVSPREVANVHWVDLTELRYADGTTWHPTASAFCHIEPNGFKLVNAGR